MVAVVTAAAVISAAPVIASATAVTAAKLGATGAMIRASMTASKVATYALGTTVAVNGASRAGEIMTGTNVIIDKIMGGNEGLYNTFETGLGIVSAATITMGQIYSPRESSPSARGSLKIKGEPISSTTTNKNYYNQTRYYDYKGNASLDIDFTNHPNSHSYHSNPRLHIWDMTKRDKYPTNIR